MLNDYLLMFFLPTFAIITIILLIVTYDMRDEFESYVGKIIITAFISAILSVIIFGAYKSKMHDELETEERAYVKYNLVTLNTDKEQEGSYSSVFFVGSGHIGENLYYHYFVDTDKGIKYSKDRAENIYIIETDTMQPKYVEYGEFVKDSEKDNPYYHDNKNHTTRRVLYIPKGTIKRNYKVN